MRDSGDVGEEVATTPYHSKVYTDNASATRSPLLTVVLAILILAVLTAAVLSVVYWVQHRSALGRETPSGVIRVDGRQLERKPANARSLAGSLDIRKADYEQFLQ
jgi:hypothetical protein